MYEAGFIDVPDPPDNESVYEGNPAPDDEYDVDEDVDPLLLFMLSK